MRIDGRWLLCEDGVIRPTLRGELETGTGSRLQVEFLLDSGADRTVLDSATFAQLALPPREAPEAVSGLGGATETVLVETVTHLSRETGQAIAFRGQFTAVPEAAGLEISVLGRDIMDLFAVIIDRPGNVVCFLSQRHRYAITNG
jgi:hypothetical protein